MSASSTKKAGTLTRSFARSAQQNRPYKAPAAVTAKHRSLHYYIRRYSSTVEAKGEIEHELLSLAAKVPFDDRFNLGARVTDLSKPLMQGFLQEIGSALAEDADDLSTEALGRQMNIVGGPTESPWPKNVGLMFFNDSPHHFFPAHKSMSYGSRKEATVIALMKRSSKAHSPQSLAKP